MKFNLDLANINYIKILFKDRQGSAHCIKSAIKIMGEKEIYACTKYEEGLIIPAPQDVTLSFVCDNGLYRTKTRLLVVNKEDPYIYFSLNTPDGLEYQQNREYFRIKLEEKAVISFVTEEEQQISISSITHDISANGVRVVPTKRTAFPENVNIEIQFPTRTISVRAKFIREDEDDNIYKASFCFTDIAPKDMDYISQVCIKKQLEYKRSTIV